MAAQELHGTFLSLGGVPRRFKEASPAWHREPESAPAGAPAGVARAPAPLPKDPSFPARCRFADAGLRQASGRNRGVLDEARNPVGDGRYADGMERVLVIKATAGEDAPERCNQAFTVAAAAVASGVRVSLWLTGEASWLAVPGRAEQFSLPHATPLNELLDVVLSSGQVTVCSQCAARRSLTEEDLIEGVRIAGAPTFVEEIMAEGAQALVY